MRLRIVARAGVDVVGKREAQDRDGAARIRVGSEGRGLSAELLALCRGEVVIPMDARSESLNAAVAASVLMWEMGKMTL